MADSGGHWSTLAEAQKLTMSSLIPGVFETDIKRNNPLDRFPVAQAANSGKSIIWNREAATDEAAVVNANQGQQTVWSEDVTYTQAEETLKAKYIQRKLDRYNQVMYGNINNYRAQVLLEMEKAIKRKIGDAMVYDDATYGTALQFNGLHALNAAVGSGSDLNIDNAEAGLSLANLRKLLDAMPHGVDEILAPYQIIRWLDAAYEEKGFVGLATGTAGNLGFVTRGINELGKRVLYWDGTPIIRTDYLVAEQANVGLTGTDLRAKHSSGDKQYSIFAVKYGNVMERQPGVCLAFGGTDGLGDFYSLDFFEKLENFIAQGFRMTSFIAMLMSTKHVLGRICDIEDVAVTV